VERGAVEFERNPLGLEGQIQSIAPPAHRYPSLPLAMAQSRNVEDVEVPPDLQLALAAGFQQLDQLQ